MKSSAWIFAPSAAAFAACLLVALPTLVALPLALENPTAKMLPAALSNIGGALLFVLAPGYLIYGLSAELLIRFFPSAGPALSVALITIGILTTVSFWTAILYLLFSACTYLRSRRHSREG